MKQKRKILEIDEERCNGCGACVSACAEGAIAIEGGKAKVIADTFCDGFGNCIGQCPQDALRIIERLADPFDDEAVARHLKAQGRGEACQCPSAAVRQLDCRAEHGEAAASESSALATWPVQLRLVPPHAPFLKGADLLVASDCTAFAYPGFHRDFLRGRVLLTGCPKLDDRELYAEKFEEIFKHNDIKSVMVVVMEVPCCQGMPMIVKSGMRSAGTSLPLETVVVSVRGEVLERQKEQVFAA